MLEGPILLYMMVTENDKSLRALAAAAPLLSIPIISKNMILEIERIIMTGKKNLLIICNKGARSAGPARLTETVESARPLLSWCGRDPRVARQSNREPS